MVTIYSIINVRQQKQITLLVTIKHRQCSLSVQTYMNNKIKCKILFNTLNINVDRIEPVPTLTFTHSS